MADPNGNGASRRGLGPTASEDCDRRRLPPGGDAIRNEVGDEATPVATIVVADDHAVVRRGLRTLLDAENGVEVGAEAGDVGATLGKVRGYKPSVLVLDLNMPGGSSREAIPRLLEASPGSAEYVRALAPEGCRSSRRGPAGLWVAQ
jgi:CheY-like chemotaxis protein